jgi:hypothetical protein
MHTEHHSALVSIGDRSPKPGGGGVDQGVSRAASVDGLTTIRDLSGPAGDQDTPLVNLVSNLSPGAPRLLRLGGNSGDSQVIERDRRRDPGGPEPLLGHG